jgi:hypothetical protein
MKGVRWGIGIGGSGKMVWGRRRGLWGGLRGVLIRLMWGVNFFGGFGGFIMV